MQPATPTRDAATTPQAQAATSMQADEATGSAVVAMGLPLVDASEWDGSEAWSMQHAWGVPVSWPLASAAASLPLATADAQVPGHTPGLLQDTENSTQQAAQSAYAVHIERQNSTPGRRGHQGEDVNMMGMGSAAGTATGDHQSQRQQATSRQPPRDAGQATPAAAAAAAPGQSEAGGTRPGGGQQRGVPHRAWGLHQGYPVDEQGAAGGSGSIGQAEPLSVTPEGAGWLGQAAGVSVQGEGHRQGPDLPYGPTHGHTNGPWTDLSAGSPRGASHRGTDADAASHDSGSSGDSGGDVRTSPHASAPSAGLQRRGRVTATLIPVPPPPLPPPPDSRLARDAAGRPGLAGLGSLQPEQEVLVAVNGQGMRLLTILPAGPPG